MVLRVEQHERRLQLLPLLRPNNGNSDRLILLMVAFPTQVAGRRLLREQLQSQQGRRGHLVLQRCSDRSQYHCIQHCRCQDHHYRSYRTQCGCWLRICRSGPNFLKKMKSKAQCLSFDHWRKNILQITFPISFCSLKP